MSMDNESDGESDNSDPTVFFTSTLKRMLKLMAFLKSPNLGTIQMGVIFTRADFRIIKITDFDHNSNSQSDSDI